VLAQLGRRERWTGDDDLVFPGGQTGYLDGSALYRRYKLALHRAGLRDLRFHDLRHTFGSLVINQASPVEVQAYLGHSDFRTTQRYLHHKARGGEAQRIAPAFRPAEPTDLERAVEAAVGARR